MFGDRWFGPRFYGNRFFGPAAGGVVTTITFVEKAEAATTSSTTSLVIPVPTGTADGDYMVLSVITRPSATAGALGGLSAWTTLETVDAADPNHRHVTFGRTASSEPASYTATIAVAGPIAAVLSTWRPSGTKVISVEDSTQEIDSVNDATISSAGVTTVDTDTVVVTAYGINDGNPPVRIPLTLHASQTKRDEIGTTGIAGGLALTQASEARAAAGATGARNATTASLTSKNSTNIVVLKQAEPAPPSGAAAAARRRRRRSALRVLGFFR